ncbi:MAG: ABC transporter glutamine-binding protein GlnH [Paracidovorax wautersii]|uniref:ABC transporter glutamine-binding protein GlnH n=1 Tax=Paracidovorax wautersii TaxID=1177982 RepID=A0A7V8FN44_9BURK|nr:MAG: ABC transporter glutamine-binding protein GlnH [Paracidovorax wautersii]
MTIRRKSFLAAATLALLPLWAHADKLADIQSKKVLRVAVTIDAAPWGYTDAAGKPTGLDVELAQQLAQSLGVQLELQQVTGANRIPYLLSNKVDVLIAALGSSPERARQVAFSKPYAATILGVYAGPSVPKAADIKQLAGVNIAMAKGSTPDLSLTDMLPEGKFLRLEDTASTISAFLSGQAQAFAENNFIAQKVADENPGKQIELKSQIRVSPAYIAVAPRETALLAEVNRFLDAKQADGSLAQLRLKWFKDEQKDIR